MKPIVCILHEEERNGFRYQDKRNGFRYENKRNGFDTFRDWIVVLFAISCMPRLKHQYVHFFVIFQKKSQMNNKTLFLSREYSINWWHKQIGSSRRSSSCRFFFPEISWMPFYRIKFISPRHFQECRSFSFLYRIMFCCGSVCVLCYACISWLLFFFATNPAGCND